MRPLPTGEPWGDYAVSTARWKGALLHDVLALARPRADGVDVRFDGADHGAYHLQPILPETSKTTSPSNAPCRSPSQPIPPPRS